MIPFSSSRFASSRATRFSVMLCLTSALLGGAGCTSDMRASAYASGGRDDWQQSDRVIASFGLKPGDAVADLGSGGGYFTSYHHIDDREVYFAKLA